jgi:hypothetical protein
MIHTQSPISCRSPFHCTVPHEISYEIFWRTFWIWQKCSIPMQCKKCNYFFLFGWWIRKSDEMKQCTWTTTFYFQPSWRTDERWPGPRHHNNWLLCCSITNLCNYNRVLMVSIYILSCIPTDGSLDGCVPWWIEMWFFITLVMNMCLIFWRSRFLLWSLQWRCQCHLCCFMYDLTTGHSNL